MNHLVSRRNESLVNGMLISDPDAIGLNYYLEKKGRGKSLADLEGSNLLLPQSYEFEEESECSTSGIATPRQQPKTGVEAKGLFKKLNLNLNYKFLSLCLVWYASSALTNNSTKLILNKFNYPLTLTLVQFLIVGLVCQILSPFISKSKLTLWYNFNLILKTCLPLAWFQVVCHILSSYATASIPVSFVHTIKALSPLFTVLASTIFLSISYSKFVYLSLVPVTLGVMMFCYNSFSFNLFGIVCALLSCLVYVAQSLVTKKSLFNSNFKNKEMDKVSILFYSSLFAFFIMLPIWFLGEGSLVTSNYAATVAVVDYELAAYFFLNGASQCGQALLSFGLLSLTDTVTFTIASQLKRVVVILAATFYFKQSLSFLQVCGIITTFFGLFFYDNAKSASKSAKANLLPTVEPVDTIDSNLRYSPLNPNPEILELQVDPMPASKLRPRAQFA